MRSGRTLSVDHPKMALDSYRVPKLDRAGSGSRASCAERMTVRAEAKSGQGKFKERQSCIRHCKEVCGLLTAA